jgi:anti-sigma factor RsiW
MSEGHRATPEEDLHAYIDNQLDPERRQAVERHLTANQAAALLVKAYAAQRSALRNAFPIPQGPVPDALNVRRLSQTRLPQRSVPWRTAAAFLLAFLAGGGGGWFMHGQISSTPPTDIRALAQEAGANHVVFAADHGHAVEIRAAQSQELASWLSRRLDRSITLPDLSAAGYRFMGGRLVATEHGPAAMLMYDDDHGTRITVYTRPMGTPGTDSKTVPIRTPATDGYAWICDGLGYAVVSTAHGKDLLDIATSVRHQVDPT